MRAPCAAAALFLASLWMLRATALAASADEARCYEQWSEAAPIVRREHLVAVDVLHRMAQARNAGAFVKSTLCREAGRWVYRVIVRGAGGQLRALTIDALRPFER